MNNKNQPFVSQFGQHLKKIREEKGLTQLDLSVMANIPRRSVGRIERGQINTTIATAEVIATALDIPIIQLFNFYYERR